MWEPFSFLYYLYVSLLHPLQLNMGYFLKKAQISPSSLGSEVLRNYFWDEIRLEWNPLSSGCLLCRCTIKASEEACRGFFFYRQWKTRGGFWCHLMWKPPPRQSRVLTQPKLDALILETVLKTTVRHTIISCAWPLPSGPKISEGQQDSGKDLNERPARWNNEICWNTRGGSFESVINES